MAYRFLYACLLLDFARSEVIEITTTTTELSTFYEPYPTTSTLTTFAIKTDFWKPFMCKQALQPARDTQFSRTGNGVGASFTCPTGSQHITRGTHAVYVYIPTTSTSWSPVVTSRTVTRTYESTKPDLSPTPTPTPTPPTTTSSKTPPTTTASPDPDPTPEVGYDVSTERSTMLGTTELTLYSTSTPPSVPPGVLTLTSTSWVSSSPRVDPFLAW
jgi:hypothetical protein